MQGNTEAGRVFLPGIKRKNVNVNEKQKVTGTGQEVSTLCA